MSEDFQEKHRGLVAIPLERLAEILLTPKDKAVVFDLFPEHIAAEVKLISANTGSQRECLLLKFEHPSFPDTRPGEPLPFVATLETTTIDLDKE